MLIGVDPGVSGAIAWFTDEGQLIEVLDMPTAEVLVGKTKRHRLLPAVLADMLRQPNRIATAAYIEQVQPMPKNGSIAGFGLGHAFGQVEGVLAALGVEQHFIPPQRWKKHYGLPGGDKEGARQRALRLWPGLAACMARKKDHGRAEACLIGNYGIARDAGRVV